VLLYTHMAIVILQRDTRLNSTNKRANWYDILLENSPLLPWRKKFHEVPLHGMLALLISAKESKRSCIIIVYRRFIPSLFCLWRHSLFSINIIQKFIVLYSYTILRMILALCIYFLPSEKELATWTPPPPEHIVIPLS
jgi:hypothetical protein